MNIQTYKHMFKDGTSITVRVDVSDDVPVFWSDGRIGNNEAEYINWRDSVIFPDLLPRLTPLQQWNMAMVGAQKQF